jgi:acid stress chaperone HdeB
MRHTFKILLAVAAFSTLATLPGSAQIRIEFNDIKCSDYMGYTPDQQRFIKFWISGYYNAAANRNTLDYNRLQANTQRVGDYCRKHKNDTLPTVINKVAS